ncbi:MAG: PEP/pyruvate-binding domain-containing protein, partial [Verrucomicrobiota bacterium]
MKREETQVAVVGGKAAALGRMLDAGFPVPAFFVCPDGVPDDLSEKLASLGGNCFAVRSSAVSEDSAAQSYAGQFESFLFVSADEVAERISDVERSGEASRLEHYAGSASERPRVVIQKMIDAVESGVAFSADPVTGDRDTVVVSRTSGTAEKLVSGEIDGETMRFRKGVGAEADPQSSDVVELVARCESLFGTPQDVEWCRDQDGKLWVVQSRPITAMPPIRRIWDNSNIAESYGGIVSPLTFSFARRVYAEVYRQFCRVMGVPESSISRQPQIFDDLLDRIEGRVYYDLGNWYRVLALLPGFSFNREFMEQMMGVKKSLPAEFSDRIAGEAKRGRWRDGLALLSSVCGLVRQAARIDNTRSAFQHRLDQALD